MIVRQSFAGPLHSFAECLHAVAVQCHQLSQTTSAQPTLPLVLLLFQSTKETKDVLPLHGELYCHSLHVLILFSTNQHSTHSRSQTK